MKLIILGSGGASPTPRPFCKCNNCKKAREIGEPYKRNSSSLFIDDVKTVVDCGEDIGDSLNRRKIKQVDNLFITHWHPDHTFGFRSILEANINFYTNTPDRTINIYIPGKVRGTLKEKYPALDYFTDVQKTGRIKLTEDGDKIEFGDIVITVIGYQGKKSDTYAYLIQQNNKKILYSPCDTISFDNYEKFEDLDILITECGLFSNDCQNPKGRKVHEISFSQLMERIKKIKPKKTVLTHIEEVELSDKTEKYLQQTKDKYHDVNFDFAYDGMEVKL